MQPKYLGRPPRALPTNAFERALRNLLGRPTPASVTALLGERAPYSSIRDWRDGRHKPPNWAREIVAKAIADRDRELLADLTQYQRTDRANIHALAAWRARRAAQKEKARE